MSEQDAGYNSDWYKRQFEEMSARDRVWSNVLADIRAVEAEEKAALLPIDAVIWRLQQLLDAADGDSTGPLEDCLSRLQEEARHIERMEQEATEAYEVQSQRLSTAARNV